jgi:subtilisin
MNSPHHCVACWWSHFRRVATFATKVAFFTDVLAFSKQLTRLQGGVMISVRTMLTIAVMTLLLAKSAIGQSSEKYIVSFQAGTSQGQRAEAVRLAGAELRFNYAIVSAAAVNVANPNALAALRRNPLIVGIVPDRRIYALQQTTATPNGPVPSAPGGGGNKGGPGGSGGSGRQIVPEGVKRVGVPTSSSNGAGVGIAILDTGIDSNNSDLAHPSQWFSAFANVEEGIDQTCHDNHGHGTHVAGIAAALNNKTGVLGVAPNATPYCVKVMDATGQGSDSDVIAGLDQVLAWNANNISPKIGVINMSLGRPKEEGEDVSETSPVRAAIRRLYSVGVVTVVAAGNDPYVEVKDMIPAGYPEVFAVSSTTAVSGSGACPGLPSIAADTASFYSTDGPLLGGIGVTVAAPGEDSEVLMDFLGLLCLVDTNGIVSLAVGGGTVRNSGTSMASPHVAGVVARFIQREGSPTNANGVETIRTRVRSTASRIGTAPLDSPTLDYTFDGEREGVVRAP